MNSELYQKTRMIPDFDEFHSDYREIEEKASKDTSIFMRNVIAFSSGVFAIIVSLHNTLVTQYPKILFLGIISLALCIIVSVVCYYIIATINKRFMKSMMKQFNDVLDGKGYIRQNVLNNSKKWVNYLSIFPVYLFVISIILLTIYICMTILC